MNKEEIEAMGKFFKQAFDMSNGTPNPDEVKYEMTKQAKDAFEKHEERLELAVKRGAEGRKEHSKVINEMKEDILAHERLADKYSQSVDKQLMQIRKDYRELQQEVLDDLSVIKDWIIATSHSDKERIRIELERHKEIEKGKLTTGMILGSSASLTPNVPGNRQQELARKENPKNKSLASLNLSLMTANALSNTDLRTVRDILRVSFRELRQIKGLGIKCVKEIEATLSTLGLRLPYRPETTAAVDKVFKLDKEAS